MKAVIYCPLMNYEVTPSALRPYTREEAVRLAAVQAAHAAEILGIPSKQPSLLHRTPRGTKSFPTFPFGFASGQPLTS